MRGITVQAVWRGPKDRLLLGVVLGLSVMGLFLIYSATQPAEGGAHVVLVLRQVEGLGLAVLLAVLLWALPLRLLEQLAPLIYAGAIALLVLTLISEEGDGARRWLSLGSGQIQTSELAKLATILLLARVLARRKTPGETLASLITPLGLALVPAALVILQPDLGTAAVYLALLGGMLFWAGVPLSRLFFLVSPLFCLALAFSLPLWAAFIGLLVVVILRARPYLWESAAVLVVNLALGTLAQPLWDTLRPYQQQRVLTFLRPDLDPQGAGWQLIQSKVAIGSGGLWGKGFLEGTQTRLAFLPEEHTDFIFSVAGEEFGFIGVTIFLGLFFLLLTRVLNVARDAENPFARLVSFGVLTLWLTHVVVNVGMVVGLVPVVGLPLPFLSFGRSFLVACFLGLALLQRSYLERWQPYGLGRS